MRDPDFAGLRAAVEDAAEHAPFDLLRDRAATRRRRRRAGTGLGLLAVAVLALATATSTARLRSDRLPATPPPTITPESPDYWRVLDVAFGRDNAYVLAGVCANPAKPVTCQYALLHSDDRGRTWSRRYHQPLPPPPAHGEGFTAQFLIGQPDQPVVIVDSGRRYVYQQTERSDTFTQRRLHAGPAVPAIPGADNVWTGPCNGPGDCAVGALNVLDPVTGVVASLAHPPPLGVPVTSAGFDGAGGLWAAGAPVNTVGRPATAYSADRGHTWRLLPVPPGERGVDQVRVWPLPDGRGAYLVGVRHDDPNTLDEFAELWRIGDPTAAGATWTRITPAGRPASAVTGVAVADGSLLVTEQAGGLWRVSPTGGIAQAPVEAGGVPLRPVAVARGAGSVLYALTRASDPGLALIVSTDEGRSWRRSPLPPL